MSFIPIIQIFEFDAAAVAHPSQFNPAPKRDPLEVVEILASFQALPKFDRDLYCRRCHAYTAGERDKRSCRRPPGVMHPDACNGCVLSHLDRKTLSPRVLAELRDKLFSRWAAASQDSLEHLFTKHKAQTPKQRDRWKASQKALEEKVEASFRACEQAGFTPNRRRKRQTLRTGDPGPDVLK